MQTFKQFILEMTWEQPTLENPGILHYQLDKVRDGKNPIGDVKEFVENLDETYSTKYGSNAYISTKLQLQELL